MAVGQSASTWLKHRHRGQAPPTLDLRLSGTTEGWLVAVLGFIGRNCAPIFQTQQWSNVGGGLLPIAVGQSTSTWLKQRHRGQAPPTLVLRLSGTTEGWLVAVLSFIGRNCGANPPDTTPVKCGRGLAPDSGGSVDIYLTETPPSGASPLPHLISVCQGRPSRWLMAVLSFIGRTGLCIKVCPNSRICCFNSLL